MLLSDAACLVGGNESDISHKFSEEEFGRRVCLAVDMIDACDRRRVLKGQEGPWITVKLAN